MRKVFFVVFSCALATMAACGASTEGAGPPVSILDDGGYVDVADPDADKARVDGGFAGPDGAVLRADRFVTKVVSFTRGACAGFGEALLPEIVLGPPVGAGSAKGSLDVLSLGIGGEIVVSFEPNAIVDGPGVDFIVFENAFFAAGNATSPVADLGEVSVSEDGTTWTTFPCTPSGPPPHGTCAGWRPVYSAPGNGISPMDPGVAGGDPYDLASIGVAKAKLVRIRDRGENGTETCPPNPPKPNNLGFDLDAIAVVNAEMP